MAGSIIALFGAEGTGKTVVIMTLFELFRPLKGVTIGEIMIGSGYFRADLKIQNKRIGFTCQSAPGSLLKEDFEFLASLDCDVIVCETLSRGASIEQVEKFKSKRHIEWVHQAEATPRSRLKSNSSTAVELWNKTIQALGRATRTGKLVTKAPLTLVSSRK